MKPWADYKQSTGPDSHVLIPVYGMREHFLEIAQKWVYQALIDSHGEYIWVNVCDSREAGSRDRLDALVIMRPNDIPPAGGGT